MGRIFASHGSSFRLRFFQIPEEKGRRVERSIGSVVVLDPQEGTARKTYRPPRLVRLLYWLSFQASFPYDSNPAALQAASYRRTIAGLLTVHRFGKDLVAPATGVDCVNGEFQFVTEYVPGPKVENDQATKQFLGQVAETFVEAGLSVWQINPLNPHAHTNLIRNSDGDLKIIDLESAVVTPFLGPGEWRSALRSGNFPVFDDIDFPAAKALYVGQRGGPRRESGPCGGLGADSSRGPVRSCYPVLERGGAQNLGSICQAGIYAAELEALLPAGIRWIGWRQSGLSGIFEQWDRTVGGRRKTDTH